MANGFYEGQIQDQAGNAVTGTVEVRGWADALLKTVYTDRDGTTPHDPHPFNSNADGSFRFFATGGLYSVKTVSGAGEKTILVQVGLAQESDFLVLEPQGAWAVGTTYEIGDMVAHGGHLFGSLVDANTGNEPDDDTPGDTAQWMLLPAALTITGTSTTSLTPGAGSKVFATQSGRGWGLGQRLRAASDDGTVFMSGLVTAYSGTSLTLNVDRWSGVSAHADWNITVDGEIGQQGEVGPIGSSALTICRLVETSNIDPATDLEPAGSTDGVVRAEGDIVLLVGQTAAEENGPYVVPSSGAASRHPSFATFNAHCGVVFSIQEGTAEADTLWHCTSDAGGTLDTDPISIVRVSANKIGFTPAGAIAATDVQAALAELDTEKLALAGGTMTGDLVLAGDPTNALHAAPKQYVDALLAAQDAMVFQGVIDCSTNPNYPSADAGHVYSVSVAGKVGGGSGPNVEIGDRLLCLTDSTATGDHATVGANWHIVQTNIDGAVVGPASATDGRFALFDGTTGELIKEHTGTPGALAVAGAKRSIEVDSGDAQLVGDVAAPGNNKVYGTDAAGARGWKDDPAGSSGREVLTANRTYFVDATDGSDSNDGLSAGSGGAFATIQKAINTVSEIDINGKTVTIQLADDTYSVGNITLKNTVGFAAPGNLVIQGNNTTPSNVVVSSTGIPFVASNLSVVWDIKDLKLSSSSDDGIRVTRATVRFNNLVFGAVSGIAHIRVMQGGLVVALGNYEIAGNAGRHVVAEDAALVQISNVTVTLTSTPAFSAQYALVAGNAVFRADGCAFSGSATGQRYVVNNGAWIHTNGGGANYFPGNSAGSGTNFGASPWGLYT